jgi:hypothetical protein
MSRNSERMTCATHTGWQAQAISLAVLNLQAEVTSETLAAVQPREAAAQNDLHSGRTFHMFHETLISVNTVFTTGSSTVAATLCKAFWCFHIIGCTTKQPWA